MNLPPDDAYGPPFAPSPLSIKTVWVVSTKNSPSEICLVRYRQLLDSMHPNQVVWQPYEAELGHLPAFCVAGRDMWTARVPLVCFWLVEKHTPERVVHQFGMVQEIPPNVDTDDALHAIDLRGKINVNWRDKHVGHIQVWNTRAQSICHGARLEGDMSPAHPYFGWYNRVTWRFVDHTAAAVLIMVASHKQMLTRYAVGSPEYNQITTVLKVVDRLHRITAQLPLEDADGANPEAAEDAGRPSTSSTPASHSHGQRAAPHQVVSRPDCPPPPHASPAPEFPPPPHASPSLEIPSRTAHPVPHLEIPLPTTHASSHPEIPSPTPRTFFDPAHLSLTPPSFDSGIDFTPTPPVMHTQSPLYSIGHIDHVPPHSDSMSFMPTPGLHTNPMIIGLTHISSATPSSPAVVGSSVVGSQAKQPDVHVEHEQVVGLPLPPQGRPKRIRKPASCGTGGHKVGHNASPTQCEEPGQGDAIPPPPRFQSVVNTVHEAPSVAVEEPVGEPLKKTYASILRVSRGQPASSAAGQPSLNRSFPTASEWNHTPQPAAQQSNSALSYVPEYAAEAVEEGLTMEEDEPKSVYVRNLPPTITEEEIVQELKDFGKIIPDGVFIRLRKEVGVCYAFVEFEDLIGVQNALKASPIQLGGRQVYIEERRPNSSGISRGGSMCLYPGCSQEFWVFHR
ncbi:hypothetical protein SO802_022364 [Lithocarpus litseifolius]|uniref:RRM domain-containing protein n=1 Tax=Lithocarpus litseifolius TaxID=425828 RepID=A0AAW2CIX9_9ROSI